MNKDYFVIKIPKIHLKKSLKKNNKVLTDDKNTENSSNEHPLSDVNTVPVAPATEKTIESNESINASQEEDSKLQTELEKVNQESSSQENNESINNDKTEKLNEESSPEKDKKEEDDQKLDETESQKEDEFIDYESKYDFDEEEAAEEKKVKEKQTHPSENSEGEQAYNQVVQDGDNGILLDIGPFTIENMVEIVKEACKEKIPICIVEKTIYNSYKKLDDKQVQKQKKVYDELNKQKQKVITLTGQKGFKKKKELQIQKDKLKKIEKEASIVFQKKALPAYHFYINYTRQDFVDKIRHTYLSIDHTENLLAMIQENETTPWMITSYEKIDMDVLKNTGNYGTILPSFFNDQSYYEIAINLEDYNSFRNSDYQQIQHTAIHYQGLNYIRMMIQKEDLEMYIEGLWHTKKREHSIEIRFIHEGDDYRYLDYREKSSRKYPVIVEVEMPFSYEKLNKIEIYAKERNIDMTYSIIIPKGNFPQKRHYLKCLTMKIKSTKDLSDV